MKLMDKNQTDTLFQFDNAEKAVVNLETKDNIAWVQHDIPNRTGSIKHFMGTADGSVVLTGKLLGDQTTKADNKTALRTIALNGTILYLDTEGYEDALNGKYVITEIDIPESGGEPWDFTLVLSQYNN